MADNTQLPIPASTGDVIAADDIGGVKFQRVKMILGADGVNDGDVSSANPVPVSMASLPLPTGATTQSLQQEIRDLSDSINTLVQFLYANSPRIDVAGRVASNGSEVTQPISGSLTTVTTVTTLSNITSISGQPQQYQGQDVPLHIYDNIKVT